MLTSSIKYSRFFSLTSTNENIKLVDSERNSVMGFNIGANASSKYQVCAIASEDSVFLTDSATTLIVLSSNGINNLEVETAFSLYTEVMQVKKCKKGSFIGYGVNYKLEEESSNRNLYFYWKRGRYFNKIMQEFLKESGIQISGLKS